MARPPLPVGTHGEINIRAKPGRGFVARAKYRDPDGTTRLVERAGRTASSARNSLLEALRDRSGPAGATAGLTADTRFSIAAARWIAGVRAAAESGSGDLSPNTATLYGRQLNNHVLPALGGLLLREVTTQRVDAFLLNVRQRRGASTTKTVRSVVSAVMRYAARQGAVTVNPTREVTKISRGVQGLPRALSADERGRWIAQLEADPVAVAKDLPDLTQFMLGTGVRIGEALAVSWDEIDLEAAAVVIEWNLIRVTGKGLQRVPRTKTASGMRTLPLPAFVVAMLRRRTLTRGHTLPLFPDSRGGWRDPSNTSRDLRNARGTAGFGWVTSHVFRKTCATILDDAGLPVRLVADQLGHSRPSLTQDVYMGRKTVNRAAAEALNEAAGSQP